MTVLPGIGNLSSLYKSRVPTLAYIGNVGDANNLSTYTFTSASIGTASLNRLVVVAVGNQSSSGGVTLNSVTIGGINATKARSDASANSGVTSTTEIWYAIVPTGTTATIVCTYSATCVRCCIVIWALYNLQSPTPFATGGVSGNNGTTNTASINIPVKGIAIAFSRHDSVTTGTYTNITENADFQFDGDTALAGSGFFLTGDSARSITTTYGASNYTCLTLASWR
jgi:hypothetical protein